MNNESEIRCVIFDLDHCIFDTKSMGPEALKPIIDEIMNSDLDESTKTEAKELLRTMWVSDVVRVCEIPQNVAERMHQARPNMIVPECACSYGDEHHIADIPCFRILVTSGFEKFQRAKIRHIGISDLFNEIIIDKIDDPAMHNGKEAIFREILKKYGLAPHQVFVVGDNPHSELGAGKKLGMTTVQTLREGVHSWEDADYYIRSLSELPELVREHVVASCE